MMPVQTCRLYSIETAELVPLCGHEVPKRAGEPGMKGDLGKSVTPQIAGHALLMLDEPSRSAGRRKCRCKIQMKASVNSLLTGGCRGTPLRSPKKRFPDGCTRGSVRCSHSLVPNHRRSR